MSIWSTWNDINCSSDTIFAALEEAERKLVESSIVLMCHPKIKEKLIETKEFKEANNIYIVCFDICPMDKVWTIEEFGLKREYIKLAKHQEEKERIKREKEVEKNDQAN